MSDQRGKIIMSEKEFEEYLDKIAKYTEKVAAGEISPKVSLNSLMKAGICDEKKNLTEIYQPA